MANFFLAFFFKGSSMMWTAPLSKRAPRHLSITLLSARLYAVGTEHPDQALLTLSAIPWWKAEEEGHSFPTSQLTQGRVRKPNKQRGNGIASETVKLEMKLHFVL